MDVNKKISAMQASANSLAKEIAPSTIGLKVIELLRRGERVSRASLLKALMADAQRHGAKDYSTIQANAAIEALQNAARLPDKR